jgi:predicted protein tyrosine phosphatase
MIIKSPMNAMHNVTNAYQMESTKVLCVCSAGILRSPTCATILQYKYGYNTRTAGISDYALIPVSTALLTWADEIVCVEPEVTEQLLYEVERLVKQDLWTQDDYDEVKGKIITLNIPDIYEQMNPTLQRIITEQYEEAINEN